MLRRKYLFLCLAITLVISEKTYNETNNSQYPHENCSIKPDDIYEIILVPVSGGTFQMGADDREDDEKPVRIVKINGFDKILWPR